MSEEVEICVRRRCPHAFQMSDGKGGYYWEHQLPCETCQSTGFVQEWITPTDLVDILLTQNHGGYVLDSSPQ